MYVIVTTLFMAVLPLASVLIELLVFKSTANTIALIGKWWVFWGVGVRLFTAGLRQAITPRFTSEEIFHFKSAEPLIVIQELGFANISIGLTGLISMLNSNWIFPAALVGAVFYGLAGIRHIFNAQRNRLENIAMVTDLWMSVVLLAYLVLMARVPVGS